MKYLSNVAGTAFMLFFTCLFFQHINAQENSQLKGQIEQRLASFKLYTSQNPCGWKKNDSLASEYNSFLSSTFTNYGYPDYTLVGEETSGKFHGLMTLPFVKPELQKQGLELMKPKVLDKKANGENFARLTDMMSYKQTGKQIYGTIVNMGCVECKENEKKFVIAPLAEPEKVNELRKSVGLPTLEEYVDKLSTAFKNVSVKNVNVQNPCKDNQP